MKIEKRGAIMPISFESLVSMSGFPQKGHWEEIPLTDADREAHARAVAAFAELESNPWIEDLSYESELRVKPLEPKRRFIEEETREEHVARWEAAGRPSAASRDHAFSSSFDLLGQLRANILPHSFGAAHALDAPHA